MKTRFAWTFGLFIVLLLWQCQSKPTAQDENTAKQDATQKETAPAQGLKHPEWSKNLSIYEVNIRQYTPEGTFKAFQTHLPRLKALGADILWLMPINPIGEKNRKGKLGSYYAVKDYKAVNPEFGTMDDFKNLVKEAHKLGMYVIVDWVPNHTAWDNPIAAEHPDWFAKNEKGEFTPPKGTDWTDVIQLDYSQPGLRQYMKEALQFWVKEADIDGYRCDVAGKVPTDFWNEVRPALDAIKPVFMLAEWEATDLHEKAFDMTYAWSFYDLMHQLHKGKNNADSVRKYFQKDLAEYPASAYRMRFVDNHDKNSWDGTMFSQFGAYLEACIVLTGTAKGMPLIYTGQEAGLDRQLKFFEKDEVKWQEHPIGDLYKKLFKLKKEHPALWNGAFGGEMHLTKNTQPAEVFSFVREKEGKKVLAVFNFSKKAQKTQIQDEKAAGEYQDYFGAQTLKITPEASLDLPPGGYRVLVQK
ncbi:MAG: alpha-amylase [Microscillaceae bacterium]|nr:alpha-amylase [Microscillaceae bacterium]